MRMLSKKNMAKRLMAIATLLLVVMGIYLPFKFAIAATTGYTPLTTLPIPGFQIGQVVNPVSVIRNIYGVSIGIAAILAVAMITWAGVEYATTEAIEGKSGAKEKWQGAIWGLALLLGAYIILRTINIDLVNINLENLGKTCYSGSGPIGNTTGVPCGTPVTANAADRILTASLASANALQEANKQVQSAQKSLADLQAQHEALAKQWQGQNMGTPEGRAAVAQLVDLEQQITAAKRTVELAQANVAYKALTQESATGISVVISNALKNNDANSAQKLVTDAKNLMIQNLQKMQDLNADPNDIALARARMSATNVILDKTQEAATLLSNLSSPSRYDTSAWYSSDTVEARQTLFDNISSVTATAATKDPAQKDVYQSSAEAIKTQFDANLAKNLGCSKGITVAPNKISCAQ